MNSAISEEIIVIIQYVSQVSAFRFRAVKFVYYSCSYGKKSSCELHKNLHAKSLMILHTFFSAILIRFLTKSFRRIQLMLVYIMYLAG